MINGNLDWSIEAVIGIQSLNNNCASRLALWLILATEMNHLMCLFAVEMRYETSISEQLDWLSTKQLDILVLQAGDLWISCSFFLLRVENIEASGPQQEESSFNVVRRLYLFIYCVFLLPFILLY